MRGLTNTKTINNKYQPVFMQQSIIDAQLAEHPGLFEPLMHFVVGCTGIHVKVATQLFDVLKKPKRDPIVCCVIRLLACGCFVVDAVYCVL
jgi:hypothetical protein